MNKSPLFLFIAFLTLLCACGTPTDSKVHVEVYSGPTMGTEYRVTVVNRERINVDSEQVKRSIERALSTVNDSMSTYIRDSEISRFNRLQQGESATLSKAMLQVTKEALEVSRFSEGAFDPTLGKAIRLWGFGSDGRITEQPTQGVLEELKRSIGYEYLDLTGDKLTKLADGLELNLSAIAKGYAVDLVALELMSLGFHHFLVNIGGELRASGNNADDVLWRVAVEKPHLLGGIEEVLVLDHKAIATSGDYRNFIVIDDQTFSHTIDPFTLKPVLHRLASVSVIADKASKADALATALLAMGEERGVAFADKHNIPAYFIIRGREGDEFELHITENFKVNLSQ